MILQVSMDAEARDVFVSAIYKAWAESVDEQKLAKAMTFDRKRDGDMASFEASKAECIKSANAKFAKYNRLLNDYKDISPVVRQMKGLEP